MKIPPHLPKKTKNLIQKETYRSLIVLGVLIVIAFVAAIAATLTTIAWIAPFSLGDTSLSSYRSPRSSDYTESVLDVQVEKQMQQRMVRVYDTREKIGQAYYAPSGLVGRAVMLTSSGWAVLHQSEYTPGEERYWESVNHQGIVFPINDVVFDPVSELVYINIEGDGFRGDVSFPDWNDIDVDGPVFAVNEYGSRPFALGSFIASDTNDVYAISAPRFFYQLTGTGEPGDIMVSEAGAFLGFLHADNRLIPSWLMSSQLQELFANKKIAYTGLSVKGTTVRAYTDESTFQAVHGLYVTQSSTRATTSTLGVGDVIVRVNGIPFDEASVARHIIFAQSPVRVEVLRQGVVIEMDIEKQPVSL
ncbi:MAG: hypothetical protein KBD15_02810 [Candidatus Magasanikbacteria bacterium]|nr:hypothetical protein [Candidatus Magasanikbacteria bacterium]